MKLISLLLLLLLLLPVVPRLMAMDFQPPSLLLAKSYLPGMPLADYLVSEKLDGVRAFWEGRRLVSRRGTPIYTPAWFTEGFPDASLDGELWIGRGHFDRLSGTVRQHQPDDSAWRQVRFMVFDLPEEPGTFDRRYQRAAQLLSESESPRLKLVKQFSVDSEQLLAKHLEAVVRQGGEGLMLHRRSSLYRAGRSSDLLKLKRHQDAEAVVIRQLPGQGRYQGQMGSLLVETAGGVRFRLGSGFSDQQRQRPPAPGTVVTYRYNGETSGGKPRFARFLRVRQDP